MRALTGGEKERHLCVRMLHIKLHFSPVYVQVLRPTQTVSMPMPRKGTRDAHAVTKFEADKTQSTSIL